MIKAEGARMNEESRVCVSACLVVCVSPTILQSQMMRDFWKFEIASRKRRNGNLCGGEQKSESMPAGGCACFCYDPVLLLKEWKFSRTPTRKIESSHRRAIKLALRVFMFDTNGWVCVDVKERKIQINLIKKNEWSCVRRSQCVGVLESERWADKKEHRMENSIIAVGWSASLMMAALSREES